MYDWEVRMIILIRFRDLGDTEFQYNHPDCLVISAGLSIFVVGYARASEVEGL